MEPHHKTSTMHSNASTQGSSTGTGSDTGSDRDSIASTVDVLGKFGIALNGNGLDQPLSSEQLNMIQELHNRVGSYREQLAPTDAEFCDLETCRRYLVARQWSLEKAEAQLISTLEWRRDTNPGARQFHESPKCVNNPLALNMRIVGYDAAGRPISYTRFSEAHDRWDTDLNVQHILLLLEANCNFIRQRRKNGLNQTADSRQSVWVADFHGFGLRDQNPRSAILVAQLLQHYPEMLNVVVLIDAPMIFNGLWNLVSPMLDDRVRSKVMFAKGKHAAKLLLERLGYEAANWIADETKDSHEKYPQGKKGNPKRYWIAPPKGSEEHDPRGLQSYVNSEYYVKTPGDAFEEGNQQRASSKEQPRGQINNNQEPTSEDPCDLPETRPSLVTSLYSGFF